MVGEELDDDRGANAIGWIVDPIDGTVNFLYDLPVVSMGIAATIGGVTVAGAVVDVVRAETFSAACGVGARGAGARREGVELHPRAASTTGQTLVGTGFSDDSRRRAEQSVILQRVLPACRDIRAMGSPH